MTRPILADSLAAKALHHRLAAQIQQGDLALPLLPASAMRVLELAQGGETGIEELAEAVRIDPALTAHMLQVANSAAFCPVERVMSVSQAISRLGFQRVAAIAVGVVCEEQLFQLPGHEQTLMEIWTHSVEVAAWSAEIARLRRRNVESAFLAGLLHDVGGPVVLEALDGLEALTSCSLDPVLAPNWMYEFHAEVGSRLLSDWSFPDEVCSAVACHHVPEEAGEHKELAHTVRLADLCAHWASEGLPEQRLVLEEELGADPSVAALNLYSDEMDALLAKKEAVALIAEAFR